MDVSNIPTAKLVSDECDGTALFIFPMGNGDWYAASGSDKYPLPGPDDKQVRFCTDGSQMAPGVVTGIALLHDLATDNLDNALWRAEMLVKELKRRTGNESSGE